MKLLVYVLPLFYISKAQEIPCNIVSVGDDIMCNQADLYDSNEMSHFLSQFFNDGDIYAFMDKCTTGANALSTGPIPIVDQDYYKELVN